MFDVNLEKELKKRQSRNHAWNAEEVLEGYKALLRKDDAKEDEILSRINAAPTGKLPNLKLDQLEPNRIFDLETIKQICVAYRLRFLDAHLFSGNIPAEAVHKIKHLQKDHDTSLSDFKIIAPASMFKLEEKDKDPLLFVPLSNKHFYLVHKWGNDMSFWRKLAVYPFRSFTTLFKTIVGLALLIVLSIPSEVMMGPKDTTSLHIRVIFFFYLFLAFSGLTAIYGFSRFKNFNANLWNSRYTD